MKIAVALHIQKLLTAAVCARKETMMMGRWQRKTNEVNQVDMPFMSQEYLQLTFESRMPYLQSTERKGSIRK